jgi:hypothetical protein
MSFEGMIERVRLQRAEDAGITKCVMVAYVNGKRYEQDRPSSHVNIRFSFPEFLASEEDWLEWADRVDELS